MSAALRSPAAALARLTRVASRAPPSARARLLHVSAARSSSDLGWCYRAPFEHPQHHHMEWFAKGVLGFMYWWMFWHIFTEPGHLTGHGVPNPRKWTDEQLGIPPDEAGL